MTRFIIAILLTVSSLALASAQQPEAASPLMEQLSRRANVTVSQPEGLAARLTHTGRPAAAPTPAEATEQPAREATTAGGYRIQVFSDNNPRTAEREAHGKAAAIREAFPQWGTYITYDSPYWRLRVGDFTTYEDATDAVTLLKNTFPAYRRELRVVRDRIRITD